jgi:2-keto-4-pentenoate hydratase
LVSTSPILEDGAEIPRGKVLQPRVEGELAFVLNSDLRGERLSVEDVINATDFISPAIEICGSRIAGWDIRIADTISDNASSGLVVLGKARMKPVLDELPRIPLAMRRGADAVADGRGEACLGNPAIAVAWLGETLTRLSGGFRAGDVIMSGALCKMTPAAPGDAFVADFGDLGSVRVQFAS